MKYFLAAALLYICLSIWSCKKTPTIVNKGQTTVDGFFKLIKGSSTNGPYATIDNQNNIIVAGPAGLNLSDLDFGGLIKQLTNGTGSFIVKYNSQGTPLWANILSVTPTSTGNQLSSLSMSAVSTDNVGNIYCVGSFIGVLTVGNTVLTSTTANALSPVGDLFLIKYDTNGNPQWVKQIAGLNTKTLTAVVADNSGKIYLAGGFYESVNFGNTTLKANGSSIFLASYSTDGNLLWDKAWGQAFPTEDSDFGTSDLKIKNNGDLVLSGVFAGNQAIDNITLQSQSTEAAFIAEFTNSGSIVWGDGYGGTNGATAYFAGFTVDTNDNIYAGGTFHGNLAAGSQNLQSLPTSDASFLLKLDNTGNLSWVNAMTGSSVELGDVNQYAGNIYCAGVYFVGNAMIGDTTLQTYTGYNSFLASFNANGKLVKAKQDGIDGYTNKLLIDTKGYLIENGLIVGNFSFGDITYPVSGMQSFVFKHTF